MKPAYKRRETFEPTIANKWKLKKKLGSGAFGKIYLGVNKTTSDQVAIKLEPSSSRHPQLYYEYKLYKALAGGVGLPSTYYYGQDGEYNVLVIDLLGKSLEDLFEKYHRKFSLKTICMLAYQMITRVEYLHSKNLIHRDIKPDNFMTGHADKENMIYIIDLGLAKRYRDPKTQKHIPYRDGKNLTGTARYASINAHVGIEQSRRDDLESLGHVFIYFNKGSLPWQGLKALTKKEKYEKILQKKMSVSVENLCRGLPKEFQAFLSYSRHLKFEDRPDYAYLKKLFKDLLARYEFEFDYIFEWSAPKDTTSMLALDEGKENIETQGRENLKTEEDKNNNETKHNESRLSQKSKKPLQNYAKEYRRINSLAA